LNKEEITGLSFTHMIKAQFMKNQPKTFNNEHTRFRRNNGKEGLILIAYV